MITTIVSDPHVKKGNLESADAREDSGTFVDGTLMDAELETAESAGVHATTSADRTDESLGVAESGTPVTPAETWTEGSGADGTQARSADGALRPGALFGHYELIHEIDRGGMGVVFLAHDIRLARRVAIKFLTHRSHSLARRFLSEARATARCKHPHIVEIYDVGEAQGHSYMVLEYLEGTTLRAWLDQRWKSDDAAPPTPALVAAMMVPVVRALAHAHARGMVHRDLKPGNIMVTTDGTIKVLDFGIAKILAPIELPGARGPGSRDDWTGAGPDTREGAVIGTRPYMSPEQWGADDIDARSDIWAVGIMLWEICAGRHPLEPLDGARLDAVMALDEPMPSMVEERPELGALAELIDHCLHKRKEARMPSAEILLHELEALAADRGGDDAASVDASVDASADAASVEGSVEGRASVASLASLANLDHLAERRAPDGEERVIELRIASALYGRESEIHTVRSLFDKVAAGGRGMLLVSGMPGIGKSTLIAQVSAALTCERGHLAPGKFDQYQRNVPYSAVARAFGDLARQLLAEPEERLATWRYELSHALGPNAQIVVDVIPELAFIIGAQAPVPALDPTEVENRFNDAFRRFLAVLCRPDSPLIAFFDDLQWADAASLRLIGRLACDPDLGHLMIVGSYRDNEVDESHPLHAMTRQVRAEGVAIECVSLGPLALEELTRLLADTLYRPRDECSALARAVLAKTGGNPFFVIQFLHMLADEGLLVFERAIRGWRWELHAVEALGITDNVVELMIERLHRLPDDTRATLRLAACVGSTFDIDTLALVSERDASVLEATLEAALGMHLIHRVPARSAQRPATESSIAARDGYYAFAHDRVQQAFDAGLSRDERCALHLDIAHHLARSLPEAARAQRIFEIAEHLSASRHRGGPRSASARQRERDLDDARLCLQAGRKALQSAAHESALRFVYAALARVSDDAWDTHYPLIYDIVRATIEAEFLNGNLDAARRWSETALDRATDVLDKVAIRDFHIAFHIARHEMAEALAIGLDVLDTLGVAFPSDPEAIMAREAALLEKLDLSDEQLAELDALPEIDDARHAAIVRIMDRIATPAFYTDPLLWKLLTLAMADHCASHGHTPLAAAAYVQYAALLCGGYQKLELGKKVADLSQRLVHRFPHPATEVKAVNTYYTFVHPWNGPWADAVEPFHALVQRGLQTGDVEFAGYSAAWIGWYLLGADRSLGHTHTELSASLRLCQRYPMMVPRTLIGIAERTVSRLLGQPALTADIPVMPGPFPALFDACARTIWHYIMGERDAAYQAAQAGQAVAFVGLGLVVGAEHNFFSSLAYLGTFEGLGAQPPETEAGADAQGRDKLATVAENQAFMARWAERSPANFAARHALIEAERARVRGDLRGSMTGYERALGAARKYGSARDEALACECAARFYTALELERNAHTYLRDAYRAYERWGARAKTESMRAQNGWLTTDIPSG